MRIASFVAKGLRENSYAVDHVTDGEGAIYKTQINTYDLLLLDVNIPSANGFDVCRRIRDAGGDIPILMLTARDAVEDRIAGLDCGADDYLIKPFE
ncbi:MAG TPA: response regulator, partial [Pyrinomonadaceae bacterium]